MSVIVTERRLLDCQESHGLTSLTSMRTCTLGAVYVLLFSITGCFSPKSGPLQDFDFKKEINRSSFVGASIETVSAETQTIIDDASTARNILATLIPIASSISQQEEMSTVDYVFDFQSGRDPLWISIDTSSSDKKLIFQIDGYVYRGGDAEEFLRIVKEVVALERKSGTRTVTPENPPRVNNREVD